MGFLDRLFGGERKSSAKPEAAEKSAVPQGAEVTPDKPRPFGYKTSWLCVKCDSPEQVISALGLKGAAPANWKSGLSQTGSRVFVSPAINGYVLAVGYGTFGVKSTAEEELSALGAVAERFDEVQCYASHRVSEFHAWAKFVKGQLVRAYGWCGCDGMVYLNEGELTPEEQRLGFDSLIQSDDDDWENAEFPDEESVIRIAAAWGINPLFNDRDYPESVGYIGSIC